MSRFGPDEEPRRLEERALVEPESVTREKILLESRSTNGFSLLENEVEPESEVREIHRGERAAPQLNPAYHFPAVRSTCEPEPETIFASGSAC